MTDHQAEQEMELEALQAIYMDDLEEVTDNMPMGWHPHSNAYRVVIKPQDESPDTEYPLTLEMVFAHTPKYPDAAPLLKARGIQGLSDADVKRLQEELESQVEENLGMAMIYTLIGVAQEWLNEKATQVDAPVLDPEAERKKREAEEEARIAAIRAHGTAVTPENFAEWKAQFDIEMALQRSKLQEGTVIEKQKRLTGKQWFLQQEAQHLEVTEPNYEDDEEELDDYSSEDEDGFKYEEDSEDDELLDEILAAKGS